MNFGIRPAACGADTELRSASVRIARTPLAHSSRRQRPDIRSANGRDGVEPNRACEHGPGYTGRGSGPVDGHEVDHAQLVDEAQVCTTSATAACAIAYTMSRPADGKEGKWPRNVAFAANHFTPAKSMDGWP